MSNKIGVNAMMSAGSPSVFSPGASPSGVTTVYGRVYSILLTDDAEEARKMHVPQGTIGAIQFRFSTNGLVDESQPTQTALHLDPNNRSFPVKNELVELVSGPTPKSSDGKGSFVPMYYYKKVPDIYNSVEHNANPDYTYDEQKGSATGDFKELGNIVRLQHAPGDIVHESRIGSSVRMGSSNSKVKMPWEGPDSAPVYIIRNGQNSNVKKGDRITVEDINNDGGSLYLLSAHTIPFDPAHYNFDSYGQPPTPTSVNTVVSDVTAPPIDDNQAPAVADAKTEVKKDEPAVTYPVASVSKEPSKTSAEEELSFIPDVEQPVFSQEIEGDAPPGAYTFTRVPPKGQLAIAKRVESFKSTSTAVSGGVSTAKIAEHVENFKLLSEKVLDPLKAALGVGITISSGYRTIDRNRAIGGAVDSQHLTGEAMDVQVQPNNKGVTNKTLFDYVHNNLLYDQLIWEFGGRWVHISYNSEGRNRKEALEAYSDNGKTKYKKR